MNSKIYYDNRPIGVLDSGVGGLTVAKEIIRLLPNERIVYIGDTARVPYGPKDPQTIKQYSLELITFLTQFSIKALVIACNTISAVFIEELRSILPIPIIEVIDPTAQKAIETTYNNRIGVIATNTTIKTNIYEKKILSYNTSAFVYEQACPLFVPLIEERLHHTSLVKTAASIYLESLMKNDIDTLVLGCTHYPFLREILQKMLGEKVQLVDSGEATAKALKKILDDYNMLNFSNKSSHQFYFTGDSKRAEKFVQLLLPTYSNLLCKSVELNNIIDPHHNFLPEGNETITPYLNE